MNLNYEQIEADIRFSLSELLSNELLANKLLSGNLILRYKDIYSFQKEADDTISVYAIFPVSFSQTSHVLIAKVSDVYGTLTVTIKL